MMQGFKEADATFCKDMLDLFYRLHDPKDWTTFCASESKSAGGQTEENDAGIARIVTCNSGGAVPGALAVTTNHLIFKSLMPSRAPGDHAFDIKYFADYPCHDDRFSALVIWGNLEEPVSGQLDPAWNTTLRSVLIRPITQWQNWVTYADDLAKFLSHGGRLWVAQKCDELNYISVVPATDSNLIACRFCKTGYCSLSKAGAIWNPKFTRWVNGPRLQGP